MKIKTNCIICQKEINVKPSRLERVKTGLACSKECRAEHFRAYYTGINNPNSKKHILAPLDIFFQDKHNKLKHTAEQRKIEYALSPEILKEHFINQNGLCYYTGVPLKLITTTEWNQKKQADPDVLSVDRLDSSLGYVDKNIVLCCTAINKMKGSSSIEEIQGIFNYIVAKNMNTCHTYIKKTRENAVVPYKTKMGDIGYDLTAAALEEKDNVIKVHTGIAVQPQPGWYFEVYPRSSMANRGLILANSAGIIDNGYTGEISLIFYKTEDYIKPLQIGERVSQLIPRRYTVVNIAVVDEFPETTDRGANGYGSTGKF